MNPTSDTAELTSAYRFVKVDAEGYFQFEETRVTDEEYGRSLFGKMKFENGRTIIANAENDNWLVEAFDEPLVPRNLERNNSGEWRLLLPYGVSFAFKPESLTVDEWDRFHGHTPEGLPFVFSRAAQAEFFNLVDEFDDDSVTIDGKRIEIGPWLNTGENVNQSSFWNEIYQNEDPPGWERDEPHEALATMLPKLKLSRSRIVVLGAGSANDAAYLARQGHLVTAIDFSEEAINQAKRKYGDVANLTFLQADAFNLPHTMNEQFDLVFEHTFYCAINPTRRKELVKTWRRLLAENGQVMGIFFAMDKPNGPPYGGSEWEIRTRLGKEFRPLYWTRWRHSIEKRMGLELIVVAQKVSLL